MRKYLTLGLLALTLAVTALGGTGCMGGPSDADVAAKNISTEAEQFRVFRRIAFINGITDTYLYEVDGFCSIDVAGAGLRAVAVTCKTGPGEYTKSYLGLSDNVTYVVLQDRPVHVSAYHYEVIFKPEAIVPDFERP